MWTLIVDCKLEKLRCYCYYFLEARLFVGNYPWELNCWEFTRINQHYVLCDKCYDRNSFLTKCLQNISVHYHKLPYQIIPRWSKHLEWKMKLLFNPCHSQSFVLFLFVCFLTFLFCPSSWWVSNKRVARFWVHPLTIFSARPSVMGFPARWPPTQQVLDTTSILILFFTEYKVKSTCILYFSE